MQSPALALKTLKLSWRNEFRTLSQTESMVFLAIASSPGIESSHIQDELELDQPHASRILKKLIEKHLIRALTLKKGESKKAYFLEPLTGATRLLRWIDGVIDGLLVANPTMMARFIASLEDAPESVIDYIEKGLVKAKQARSLNRTSLQHKPSYDLAKRNRSDLGYRKLLES